VPAHRSCGVFGFLEAPDERENPSAGVRRQKLRAAETRTWICGRAAKETPCRTGRRKGHCCATAECKPIMELKPAKPRGAGVATPNAAACESGPLPMVAAAARSPKCRLCQRCDCSRGTVDDCVSPRHDALFCHNSADTPGRNGHQSGEISQAASARHSRRWRETNPIENKAAEPATRRQHGPEWNGDRRLQPDPGHR